MMQHDVELVRACKTGSRDAMRQLYEENRHTIFQLVARMAGEQEAADITQQVFVRALSNIERFEERSALRTWLHRIAVNESLQFLRKSKRNATQASVELHEPQQPADNTEDSELLDLALKRLSPELKAIFLLREVEELSYREIAAMLDISEGTVASRLNRARRELRDILTRLGWEE